MKEFHQRFELQLKVRSAEITVVIATQLSTPSYTRKKTMNRNPQRRPRSFRKIAVAAFSAAGGDLFSVRVKTEVLPGNFILSMNVALHIHSYHLIHVSLTCGHKFPLAFSMRLYVKMLAQVSWRNSNSVK